MNKMFDQDNKKGISLPKTNWFVFGLHITKTEVVYFTQVVILYIIIIAALINISLSNDGNQIWIGLLGSCIGYLLPNPNLIKQNVLRHSIDEIDNTKKKREVDDK